MDQVRVLLVDDEPALRQTFAYALQNEGFHVWVAEHGQEGLELFRSVEPHVVVSDILMPHVDGFTAIDAMRAENPAVPIIAISGATGAAGRLQAERCGASVFLRKPVEIKVLLTHIGEITPEVTTTFI